MIRVIVNGDDFGMNERCSLAIAQAFRDGIITDTTMMANGTWFDQAAQLAFEQGFCEKIGIHFNLTEGEPLTDDVKRIPDFVCERRFHKGFIRAPRLLDETEAAAVYKELAAQIDRIKAAGFMLTHADSHHYLHNNSYLAPIFAQVCRDYGINKIRLQRNLCDADNDSENNRFWREMSFISTDYFGRMSDIADGNVPDRTEIMVHPDFDVNKALIDRRGTENGFPIGERLYALSSSEIVLQSYRDI